MPQNKSLLLRVKWWYSGRVGSSCVCCRQVNGALKNHET